MDMVAEYAHAYGGPPHPEQPWHEFLALVQRTARFRDRQLLQVWDGTALAQVGENSTLALYRAKLERTSSLVMRE